MFRFGRPCWLAADSRWSGRAIPAFRPDRYLEPTQPGRTDAVARLGEAADVDIGDYACYVRALEQRRMHFIANGATPADHRHDDVRTDPLVPSEAERSYRAALADEATASEALAFRRHMPLEMARISCDDGLVMTLHPAVRRNHYRVTFERMGEGDALRRNPLRLGRTFALEQRGELVKAGRGPGPGDASPLANDGPTSGPRVRRNREAAARRWLALVASWEPS